MMKKIFNEKFIIGTLTAVLLAVIVLFVFSPKAIAQTKDDKLDEELLLFRDVLEFVQSHYVDESKVETKKLIEGALKGMIESMGDPHSQYLTEDEMKDMEETTTGKFGGVGLYISKVGKGIEVARPIPGTPAFRAGVSAGDIIIAVGETSTVDLKVDEVVKMLKGSPGTKVKITILRGESNTFDLTITREMIELPVVKKAMMPNGIAYLEILQFTPLTYDRTKEALEFFAEKKYKSLIIDVRSNPGGLLSAVVDIGNLFFDAGTPIVSTKSRFPSEDKNYTAKSKAFVPKNIPIVVLIDKYSASAAEILTGALKDNGRAYIIGQKSYGKASVQQIQTLGDAGFKLTIARYYTPSGISIDQIGIKPDKAIDEEKLTKDEEQAFEKLNEKSYIEDFVKKNKTPTEKDLAGLIQSLKTTGINIRDKYIKKLVRNELNKTNNNPPEYDLEYDTVLQEAVGYFEKDKTKEQAVKK
jgi:carboxyl-terminal processing protease